MPERAGEMSGSRFGKEACQARPARISVRAGRRGACDEKRLLHGAAYTCATVLAPLDQHD